MLTYLRKGLANFIDDLGYNSKRALAYTAGKEAAEPIATMIPQLLLGAISGATATAVKISPFHPLLLGTVAAISAGITQADHKHRRNKVLERYREEIAADPEVNKSPGKVTEQDMEIVAKKNPALHDVLNQSAVERNIGVFLSAFASVAVFALMHSIPAIHDLGSFHAVSEAIQNTASTLPEILSQVGGLIGKGMIGVASYYAIKTPLHYLAGELTGLEKETVNDKITDIKREAKRGRAVTPELVFEVYLEANPQINEQIKEEFGKEYEHLTKRHKREVVALIQEQLDLERMAADINTKRVKPEELAFAAYGQVSGVARKEGVEAAPEMPKQPGRLARLWNNWMSPTPIPKAEAGDTLKAQIDALPGQTMLQVSEPAPGETEIQLTNNYEEPGRKQSFVAMVGRKGEREGMSFVQRLESSEQLSPALQK